MTPCGPCRSPALVRSAENRLSWVTPGRIMVMVLGVVPLLGCSTPAQSSAPTSPSTATVASHEQDNTDLAEFLAELTTARADRAAWSALLDPRDPDLAPLAERVRQNLSHLEVRFAPAGRTHRLTTGRQALLGPTAQARAVRVEWSVAEHAPAAHVIWLTLTSDDGRIRLAGLTDGPATDGPVPLWLLEPVQVLAGDRVAVLTGEGVDPAPWLTSLTVARADVAQRGLDPAPLIAHVPSREFERLLGVGPASHRSVAAAAWRFGDTIHLVVNPSASRLLQEETRQVLLSHEAVHVTAGLQGNRGPLWLSEGYADLVALERHPVVAEAHERHLAEDQRRHGVAAELVRDAELDPANSRVDAHYQRAWLTVRVLDRSDRTADRVHAAVRAGTPLDRALADEGWTESELASAVHAELLRLVG